MRGLQSSEVVDDPRGFNFNESCQTREAKYSYLDTATFVSSMALAALIFATTLITKILIEM